MMNFDEWCYETQIEDRWKTLKDEYGDAVPLLSEYKEQEYREYVLTFGEKPPILNQQ